MQKFKSKIYWILTVLPDDPKEDWKTLVLETTKPSTLGKNITLLLFFPFETWGKFHLDNGLGELRTWRSWGLWKPLWGINRAWCHPALCLKCYAWNPGDLWNSDHMVIFCLRIRKQLSIWNLIHVVPSWLHQGRADHVEILKQMNLKMFPACLLSQGYRCIGKLRDISVE